MHLYILRRAIYGRSKMFKISIEVFDLLRLLYILMIVVLWALSFFINVQVI